MRVASRILPIAVLMLAACDRPAVERIELADSEPIDLLAPIASPDTEGANWQVTTNQRGIVFTLPDAKPLLTLGCETPDNQPQVRLVRHAPAQPGAKALFAVLGNGTVSRFNLDAKLAANEWRWEGVYSAEAPQLQVFTGPRDIEATLPGGGTLQIAGSAMPREFLTWCRTSSIGETVPEPTGAGEVEAEAIEELVPEIEVEPSIEASPPSVSANGQQPIANPEPIPSQASQRQVTAAERAVIGIPQANTRPATPPPALNRNRPALSPRPVSSQEGDLPPGR
jgi:hypothetical protein